MPTETVWLTRSRSSVRAAPPPCVIVGRSTLKRAIRSDKMTVVMPKRAVETIC